MSAATESDPAVAGAAERPDPAQRGEARNRVLAAAREAISAGGPEKVTVRDIARRAGMSPGHVMYYFGRRERILIETLLLSEQDLAETRSVRLARHRDPWLAVRSFIDLYLPQQATDIRWNLWTQMYARPPRDAESRERLTAVEQHWSRDLTELVRTGSATGRFRASGPEDRPEDAAFRLCKLLDGLALEVILDYPGRDTRWARRTAEDAARRELLPADGSTDRPA